MGKSISEHNQSLRGYLENIYEEIGQNDEIISNDEAQRGDFIEQLFEYLDGEKNALSEVETLLKPGTASRREAMDEAGTLLGIYKVLKSNVSSNVKLNKTKLFINNFLEKERNEQALAQLGISFPRTADGKEYLCSTVKEFEGEGQTVIVFDHPNYPSADNHPLACYGFQIALFYNQRSGHIEISPAPAALGSYQNNGQNVIIEKSGIRIIGDGPAHHNGFCRNLNTLTNRAQFAKGSEKGFDELVGNQVLVHVSAAVQSMTEYRDYMDQLSAWANAR